MKVAQSERWLSSALVEETSAGGFVRKSWIPVFLIWLILTILGLLLVMNTSVFPALYSEQGEHIDASYDLLEVVSVPVMALIFAVMIWGAIAWRSNGAEREDGPPQRGGKGVIGAWLVVSLILAVGTVINPGFVGLAAVRGEPSSDYVIDLTGSQFSWRVDYPNGAVGLEELVVPVDKRIKFNVNSTDVVHSFWVPAFRTKIDAVPGRQTFVYITPTHTGTMEDDVNLRIQCAELCGSGHAGMMMPVRVVEDGEWNTYIDDLKAGG